MIRRIIHALRDLRDPHLRSERLLKKFDQTADDLHKVNQEILSEHGRLHDLEYTIKGKQQRLMETHERNHRVATRMKEFLA